MDTTLIPHPTNPYIESLPGSDLLDSEQAALDLVAACGESNTFLLLLHAENLPDDFYNLRTGLAGNILQKFVNYHLHVAAVLTPDLANQGRFGEMVREANRGNQFNVFYDHASAERWLTSL
jgi:PadR family transcriptional regulator, regulatory protein AphA